MAGSFSWLLPGIVMAEDVIHIGLFNKDPAIIAADAKGFFNKENIEIQIDTVTDSPTLLSNLISGKYDLIMNNADNVIAWAEGQGEDPQKNDFIIFLGGNRGVNQKLIVGPGINDYGDLKGTIFAVDAPTTGYAIVGVYILKKQGLELNKDYTFKAFGNTNKRAEAMSRATDWVTEPNHKDGVITMLMPENRNNKARAEAMYEESISPRFGFSTRSQIDVDGIQSVLQLREIAGLMKPPLPKAEKYVDERFYKEALA